MNISNTLSYLLAFILITSSSLNLHSQDGKIGTVSLGGSILNAACLSDVCHGFVAAHLDVYDENDNMVFIVIRFC